MSDKSKDSSKMIWNDSYLSWPPDVFTPHSEVIAAVNDGVTELIRNGAQQVLISYAAADTKENHSNFQTLCAREGIQFDELSALCFAQQYEQVKKFLAPLVPSRANEFVPDIATHQLEQFLCSMLIANRERAHIVDQKKYGPTGALWAIDKLRSEMKDPAAWRAYDRLEGLIRSYAGLTAFRFRGGVPLNYYDLKKIMLTDDYRALSSQYALLGIHDHPADVLITINCMVQRMAGSHVVVDILRIANIVTSVVASSVTPVVAALEYVFDKIGLREDVSFVPVFIESSLIGWQQYNVQNTKDG